MSKLTIRDTVSIDAMGDGWTDPALAAKAFAEQLEHAYRNFARADHDDIEIDIEVKDVARDKPTATTDDGFDAEFDNKLADLRAAEFLTFCNDSIVDIDDVVDQIEIGMDEGLHCGSWFYDDKHSAKLAVEVYGTDREGNPLEFTYADEAEIEARVAEYIEERKAEIAAREEEDEDA